MRTQTPLTEANYSKGFLIDEELMGGITASPDSAGSSGPPGPPGPDVPHESYVAYVLCHTTGEYLGYQPFPTLPEALAALNQVERDWKYEAAGGCDGSRCGEGRCKGSKCGLFRGTTTEEPAAVCAPGSSPAPGTES